MTEHVCDKYNCLTKHGVLATDPRLLVKIGEELYGAHLRDSQELVDAVVWQAGVPISGYDQYIRDNAHVVVTVTIRNKTVEAYPYNTVHYVSSPDDEVISKTLGEWAGLKQEVEKT